MIGKVSNRIFLLGWETLILHVDFPFIFNHLIHFCLKDYILLNKIRNHCLKVLSLLQCTAVVLKLC